MVQVNYTGLVDAIEHSQSHNVEFNNYGVSGTIGYAQHSAPIRSHLVLGGNLCVQTTEQAHYIPFKVRPHKIGEGGRVEFSDVEKLPEGISGLAKHIKQALVDISHTYERA